MMDGTYECECCGRSEQVYKCIHLEEGKRVVCANCFYKAQEKMDIIPWKLAEVIEGKLSDETLKKKRNDYLSALRKHIMYFNKNMKGVIDYFIEREIQLSKELLSKDRKELTNTEILTITNALRYNEIPKYFGELIGGRALQKIKLEDYYTHRDYEVKLRTMMK